MKYHYFLNRFCYGFQVKYWPIGLTGISNLPVLKKTILKQQIEFKQKKVNNSEFDLSS
jgi:hypothetical protein